MKSITKLTIIVFLLFTMICAVSTLTYAEIPKLINYQGRLTDSQGAPIIGTRSVTFRIYDTESGGSPLWQETQTATLDRGIFNVFIGGVTPLNLPFDKQYYLGIQVGSDPEMAPRQQLASNAYAFTSENVSGVVPVVNGGTAATTANNALNNLLPSQPGNTGKFLKTDGSNTNWAPTPTGFSNIQVFTSSGTFTKPTGVDKVFVIVVGGGGGAGGNSGGGGGGGYATKLCTLTNNVAVSVGAGGGGAGGGDQSGSGGGTSSFGAFCSASGGGGGNYSGGAGGIGGTGSGGDINISGERGHNQAYGGDGGASMYGWGGQKNVSPNGSGYGGGGASSAGSGAPGIVIVMW